MLTRLWVDERAASLLEYVGLAILVLLAVWAAATSLGKGVSQTFGNLKDKLTQ